MEMKMRGLTLSLILGFTLVLSGASNAGSSDNGVPHAGLFQLTIPAPAPVVMASR
jgi:hypothetical protein